MLPLHEQQEVLQREERSYCTTISSVRTHITAGRTVPPDERRKFIDRQEQFVLEMSRKYEDLVASHLYFKEHALASFETLPKFDARSIPARSPDNL